MVDADSETTVDPATAPWAIDSGMRGKYQLLGCATTRRYGFSVFQPFGYFAAACSFDTAGGMMTSCPGCQFTGVAAAQPLQKLTFATDWLAQAEHGGFYQAQAEGLYRKLGLDVAIRMGGPQVNGLQLLAAGQLDVVMADALQMNARHGVATPVNWKPGQDVIIPTSVSDEDAKKKYPQGFKTLKPYLRTVAQPK